MVYWAVVLVKNVTTALLKHTMCSCAHHIVQLYPILETKLLEAVISCASSFKSAYASLIQQIDAGYQVWRTVRASKGCKELITAHTDNGHASLPSSSTGKSKHKRLSQYPSFLLSNKRSVLASMHLMPALDADRRRHVRSVSGFQGLRALDSCIAFHLADHDVSSG